MKPLSALALVAVCVGPPRAVEASGEIVEPPCDVRFCDACFIYCGLPTYECKPMVNYGGVISPCEVDPICEVCEDLCPKELDDDEECPAHACRSDHKECPPVGSTTDGPELPTKTVPVVTTTSGPGDGTTSGGGDGPTTSGPGDGTSSGGGEGPTTSVPGEETTSGGGDGPTTSGPGDRTTSGGGDGPTTSGPGDSTTSGGGDGPTTSGPGDSTTSGGGDGPTTSGPDDGTTSGGGDGPTTNGPGDSTTSGGDGLTTSGPPTPMPFTSDQPTPSATEATTTPKVTTTSEVATTPDTTTATTTTTTTTKCNCPDTSEKPLWDAVKDTNNCYNHAANDRDGTFAQPGWLAGKKIEAKDATCALIEDAVMADATLQGKEVTKVAKADETKPDEEKCPEGKCLVALYVAKNETHPENGEPFNDYHWFRYNDESPAKPWSHKPGRTVVVEINAPPMPTHIVPVNRLVLGLFVVPGTYTYHFCSFLCFPWDLDVTGIDLALFLKKSIRSIQKLLGFLELHVELTLARVEQIFEILFGPQRRRLVSELQMVTLPPVDDPEWGENLDGGFEVVNSEEFPEFPERIRVFGGVIEIQTDGSIAYYEDTNSTLRNYFIDEFEVGPVFDGTYENVTTTPEP